jgi:hypothetical protein
MGPAMAGGVFAGDPLVRSVRHSNRHSRTLLKKGENGTGNRHAACPPGGTENGKIIADNVPAQDMVGWVGQGPISDRTEEHLASSDKGVILCRKMLMQQMERVARGEEPMAVIRDRSENEPMVSIRRERRAWQAFQS